ncbi:MAG: radical SAM protein [Methanospirillum sp.]|nr:radical SAM protein [Methanospirillum sp.]
MDDISSDDIPPHSRLSSGCRLCYEGAKLVLFLTGMCHRDCWYCPLSRERKNRDVIYANEHQISSPEEMISIARRMSALGTGITGGEPFLFPDRLREYAGALKKEFGSEHQIHLYTALAPDSSVLDSVKGLVDEIRYHPPHEIWENLEETPFFSSMVTAKKTGFEVGIEVPSLPGISVLEKVLPYIDFVNINELEWGDSNADEMRRRGHRFRGDVSNAVLGGWENVRDFTVHPKVHWCSSDFKDRVQLRMRLLRIAENTARRFDEITEDGTIIYGVWECDGKSAELPGDPDEELYARFNDRIETAWWILDQITGDIEGKAYFIERYPDGGIILEVTPV